MSETKLGKRFWVSMLVFGLMGQIAWVVENMYFNVFIYKMFHATAAEISAMVMASAVMAALTTIVMGALSDKVGRRKAFMSYGYMLWGASIIVFAYIRNAPRVKLGAKATDYSQTADPFSGKHRNAAQIYVHPHVELATISHFE